MGDKDVSANLYENGDWLDHKLPREIAQSMVRDLIKQMVDEPIHWLLIELPHRQLQELVEAVRVEMRERERSPQQPPAPEFRDGLKLLGDV